MAELVLTDVDDVVLDDLGSALLATDERPQRRQSRSWRKRYAANAQTFGSGWTPSTAAWRPRGGLSAIVRTCCARTESVERNRRGCQRRGEVVPLEKSAARRDYAGRCRSNPWATPRTTADAASRGSLADLGFRSGRPYPADGLRLPVPGISRAIARANGDGRPTPLQQFGGNALGWLHLLGWRSAVGTMNHRA